jgi:3',5'-cyclic AMP phosphodiesterase CpdA
MLIAQLSDLHVMAPGRLFRGGIDTAARLKTAIDDLMGQRRQPDAILLTGDLVDRGAPEEYAALKALLAPLAAPLLPIPGNHDARDAMRAAFAGLGLFQDARFLHFAVDLGPIRVIGLDSLDPGKVEGRLCAERLDWLDARLAEVPARPTLIALHHPPCPTGIPHMEPINLVEPAGFAAVIHRHPQVRRIVSGHVHRPIESRFAGVPCSVAPATAPQLMLDLRAASQSNNRAEPPGYGFHLFQDGDFIGHVVTAGDFGPPV